MTLETETNVQRWQYRVKGGLSYKEYDNLHYHMQKERPKPTFCEMCKRVPPLDLACIDKYEPNPENFRWMCRSCHMKFDFENDTRVMPSGEMARHFGKKHTLEARQKMHKPKPSISGDKHPNFGKRCSDEVRLKMSEARQGRFVGDKNPFFGKHPSAISRLRRKLAWESRRYALLQNMNGTFHIPEQEWMKNA